MKKLGLIHYNAPGTTLPEFLKWAADTGFKFLELMPPDVVIDGPSESEVYEQARTVRKLVASYGLRVSAFSARNDFLQVDPSTVVDQVERMKKVARVVRILDDEAVVRSEGGFDKDAVPREKWSSALYECFARCRDFLEEQQVDLAVDNHGTVTNEGDLLIALLKRLNSPRIGSNVDTMNFRWLGHDIATCNRFYKELAPFVKHVHLKDGTGSRESYKGAALGEGEIDISYATAQFEAAGYKGAYAAEYEGPEIAGGVGYTKCLAWMRAHI
ncbi:MAG: sugar phosphate isomerase/epimerase [Capsulimonadaceae bacterium]|nr:sugar phosphate isomerase/epimerase [Capsulimonadaceae bacterium]